MSSKTTKEPITPTLLFEGITLPCGVSISNRLGKSAMSEALGDKKHAPTKSLMNLYRRWSNGGTGLLITGNVMVDARYLGEPGNVVLNEDSPLDKFVAWANAATEKNNHCWMQLNHPGKQTPSFLCKEPIAPSAVPLKIKNFAPPREMREDEIWETIAQFGKAAALAKETGFSGVQIHGAHGYLVSEFLSPHHNQRQDEWGGNAEKRAKFVSEVYQSIRNNVGNSFPISIKINSADFQRGGFEENESLDIIKHLSDLGADLIEISGGNYESPKMMTGKKKSTEEREAYFIKFSSEAKKITKTPLMLTGGFRTPALMEEALHKKACDLIGLARPLALFPDLPKRILHQKQSSFAIPENISSGIKTIDQALMLNLTWYTRQLAIIGKGKEPKQDLNPLLAAAGLIWDGSIQNIRRRRA